MAPYKGNKMELRGHPISLHNNFGMLAAWREWMMMYISSSSSITREGFLQGEEHDGVKGSSHKFT